ncbi:hypothetical protein LV84_00331 [Algoriphagus ratkowskyi]|uniref:Uncharacterized protein n=1 Tax=Algoriphagus ratkowskyi TaxID=57028 RepID=A0A2W7RKJ2_9BACT|nr:hypothetical protein LV84_00331 [Algoriphagus ratkowskyi]
MVDSSRPEARIVVFQSLWFICASFMMLDELRDEEIEIRFSKRSNSFIFDNCKGLNVFFSLEVLELSENRNISTGKSLNYVPASKILD